MQICQTHNCDRNAVACKSRDVHGVPIEYYVCAFHNDRIDAEKNGRKPIYETPQDAPEA